MKKNLIKTLTLMFCLLAFNAYAADTVFDSMGNATEVKLAPAINTKATTSKSAISASSATTLYSKNSIKEQKFSNAIVNLDDAQVELRQELAEVTEKYNAALQEKQRVLQNCKTLKKELKAINKNMKNIESAKKNINKNLES